MIKYVKDNEWGTVFPNFQKWEFMCNHKSVGNGIYYSLLEVMQEKIRNVYGSVNSSCGYRCPSCNASVGGASNSAHLYGGACDFRINSGWQDNLENRKRLVTQLRQDPRVHYCYCRVDDNHIWDGYTLVATSCNMGTYIHVDTYATHEVRDFNVEADTTSFKVNIDCDDDFDWCCYSLNGGDFKNLPPNGYIKDLEPNTTYKLKLKLRNKGTDLWTFTNEKEFKTKDIEKPQEEPIKENIPNENINIPDNTKTTENEPLNGKIEHPTNNVEKRKSILQIIIELIFGIFMKRR